MLITKGQLINIIKSSLNEDIAYSSPAYGNIVIDDPGTDTIPAVSDLNILYQRSMDAGDAQSAKLIKLLNSELTRSVIANDTDAWERIGEFMLSNLGFTQQTDITGGPKVATFYDVVKNNTYYSVKTSFRGFSGTRSGTRAAVGASPLKVRHIDYIMQQKYSDRLWAVIGCVKQKSQQYPGAIDILWGATPAKLGADFEIDESFDMELNNAIKFVRPNVLIPFQGAYKKKRDSKLRAAGTEALFGTFSDLWRIKLMPDTPVDPEVEAFRGRLMRLAGTAEPTLLNQILSLLSANGIIV